MLQDMRKMSILEKNRYRLINEVTPMRKRFIIFLVRRHLGLKKCEYFVFKNQKSPTDYYYFTKDKIIKVEGSKCIPSSVSLNWLLDENCEIEKLA